MAQYFNANQLKKGQATTITLANGLSVALSKLPSGSIGLEAEFHGESHTKALGASDARKCLSQWEQLTLKGQHTPAGETVAYVRVSSEGQNTARQLAMLEQYPVSKIFEEKASGKDTDRPKLAEMLGYIREGDTVLVHSLDRLARSLPDLRQLVEQMNEKGVTVKFIKNSLTFRPQQDSDPASMLMLNVMGAIAEFERAIIKERQAEGIAKAKAKGVYKGRPAKVRLHENIKKLITQGLSIRAVAKELQCSPQTVQTVKNTLKKESELTEKSD